ncbi:MAG TPA: hypothetical protein VFR84_03820 [Candidatus Angelobacter sp.]|nr:hypothetical protein [Candidatus Angelobacter sp.]
MADNKNALKLWHQAASATVDCLPLETLETLAENTAADSKAAAHLASCSHCQTELSMLKSFEDATPSADEGAAVAWIAAQLQRRQLAPAQKSSAPRVSFWRSFFRVPYLAGAAAAVLALALGISLYNSNSDHPRLGQPGNIGINRSGEIKLLSPVADQAAVPPEFRWEAVANAASYKVELTDVLGKPLAGAASTQPLLAATPEMKAAMHSGMPVNWKVTAYDATGKAIAESTGGSFKIR